MSAEQDITARVESLLAGPVAGLGCQLLEVQYRHEGRWVLRLVIDREPAVRLEDCGAVSELAGRILDVEDPIPQAFELEVTSPGMFRPLKEPRHFGQSVGKVLRFTWVTEGPPRTSRVVRGTLESMEGELLHVRELPTPEPGGRSKKRQAGVLEAPAPETAPLLTVPLAQVRHARLDPEP
ncbi:MAG TPA: ribosome maturation factor RimP [bacterium]|nr:ribosome maturation factor RimP [bacterium]